MSYLDAYTSGTPFSTPVNTYTASIAVRPEYSIVNTVSLPGSSKVSANCPRKAKLTAFLGTT